MNELTENTVRAIPIEGTPGLYKIDGILEDPLGYFDRSSWYDLSDHREADEVTPRTGKVTTAIVR